MNHDTVRFDEAAPRARATARAIAGTGITVLVVRDFVGRFTLILDDRDTTRGLEQVEGWRERLRQDLGNYASEDPLLLGSELFAPESLLESPRRVLASASPEGAGNVYLLDNTVVGEEWSKVIPLPPEPGPDRTSTARTTLYGFKGGVGRSTATYLLGRHLAGQGRCVLIVDLDLESPGAGPLLLDEDHVPAYGVVDYLVEAAVGNADDLDLVVRASHLSVEGNGELWVAPARGGGFRGPHDAPYSYVDKLNRVYADVPRAGEGPLGFADRLEEAVAACEKRVADLSRRPDAVLLDSRAGIHDIAAVAISRLCDLALLFGSDNGQTWRGYEDLFQEWQESGQAENVREKLRVVASMVPANRSGEYLASFRDHAMQAFSLIYDDVPARDEGEAFNPDLEDESAPHAPIPILFTADLVGLDSGRSPDWCEQPFVHAAYEEFLSVAGRLVMNEDTP
ncbi:KGGVGR-motif variant AAA ATPase [Nocardiopsis sp. NPDC058631]|uniref:KGGVGR-motif variant AAA ATPase n=1 Tax=Nocardiopsis sp. NPDC058631 TaxID=3346566 RepID=UPI003669165C